jgi:signal transduction histidine kinase
MAHELRTPLHAARLALHLLELGHGEVSTHLGHLRRANEQLTVLVDEARLAPA